MPCDEYGELFDDAVGAFGVATSAEPALPGGSVARLEPVAVSAVKVEASRSLVAGSPANEEASLQYEGMGTDSPVEEDHDKQQPVAAVVD